MAVVPFHTIGSRHTLSRPAQVRPTPVRLNSGKIVGFITMRNGRRIFERRVNPAIHQMRKPRGWALSLEVISALESRGVRRMRLIEADGLRVWSASVRRIRRRGFLIDHGHGEQLLLPIRFWKKRRRGQ